MKKLLIALVLIFPMFSFQKNLSQESPEGKLAHYSELVQKCPSYSYPYHGLANTLAKEGKSSLPLFSYGSLMDVESASETLSKDALKTRRPALGFGIKRIFDRDVPIKPRSHWGTPHDPKARGMLNVHPVSQIESFVNGVLIDIPLKDLEELLDREEGYDLIPIVIADWNSLLKNTPEFSIAYTLYAPTQSSYTSHSIYPRPGYYEFTRDAATQFGPLFSLLWQNTTFMADGQTPITVWEHWLDDK